MYDIVSKGCPLDPMTICNKQSSKSFSSFQVAKAFGISKLYFVKNPTVCLFGLVELLGKEFIKIATDENDITSLVSQFYA